MVGVYNKMIVKIIQFSLTVIFKSFKKKSNPKRLNKSFWQEKMNEVISVYVKMLSSGFYNGQGYSQG